MDLRHKAFAGVFRAIAITGADRWAAPLVRGRGVILTLHRVCQQSSDAFAPNRILDVTPAFLDYALGFIRFSGFDLVSMDEAVKRICDPEDTRFFVALTFDDGFRDVASDALPILQRNQTPACVYVVPGFAGRTAPLWWLDLQEAVRGLSHVEVNLDEKTHSWSTRDTSEKRKAFSAIYWMLRARPEAELRAVIAALAHAAQHDSSAQSERLCMDWKGIKQLAADPLITIGAHTMTHPRLAKISEMEALSEITTSKSAIESHLSREVRHFAYPVGDASSAAAPQFQMVKEAGFLSAVTTRPGHVFAEHAAHLCALPRVSLNGLHQNIPALRAVLSGLPFLAVNRGKKLNVM